MAAIIRERLLESFELYDELAAEVPEASLAINHGRSLSIGGAGARGDRRRRRGRQRPPSLRTRLLAHEAAHQGQLIRYLYGLQLPIPARWNERYVLA